MSDTKTSRRSNAQRSDRPPRYNTRTYKTKKSYGIACVRFTNGTPEVLLVCKRITYAFGTFVQGKYNSNSATAIIELFNRMTPDEKLTILSLNFEYMWYKVWADNTPKPAFHVARTKFDTAFLRDGGARLRRLINGSRNDTCVWEIPKGHKRIDESDLQCAVREFVEETGVSKDAYKIIPGLVRTMQFVDEGVRYICSYHVGVATSHINQRVNFHHSQISEIIDMRWMSAADVTLVDKTGHLHRFVRGLFHSISSVDRYHN